MAQKTRQTEVAAIAMVKADQTEVERIYLELEQTTSQLNARLAETISTAGDGTVPTELTDIRVDNKGNRFAVASERVLNVGKLFETGFSNVLYEFETGGINWGTGELSTSNYAIRTRVYIQRSKPLYLLLGPNIQVWILFYSLNNVYIERVLSSSVPKVTFVPKSDLKYKMFILNKDNSPIFSLADIMTCYIRVL